MLLILSRSSYNKVCDPEREWAKAPTGDKQGGTLRG